MCDVSACCCAIEVVDRIESDVNGVVCLCVKVKFTAKNYDCLHQNECC
jgi:hypothetical protein